MRLLDQSSPKFVYPFFLAILGIIAITISWIVEITSEKIYPIAWAASFFIMLSSLVWRFYSIDSNKFVTLITETNVDDNYQLQPLRFLNGMPLALSIGFVATIVIYYDFVVGMVIYLFMQLSLIYAFSGIFVIDLRYLLSDDANQNQRTLSILSLSVWSILVIVVYSLFVYSGSDSLIVIPYVIALGTMAHFSWYGLLYFERGFLFRWLPVIASAFFVFSDSLIGNLVYGPVKASDYIHSIIDVTYVINIFLMCISVLFLRQK